jgi:putative FmdB family regulatory protein
MPIYEYLAEQCLRQTPCSRRKEYLQSLKDPVLSACKECGASIRKVMSSFAARSGEFGVSSPDPTPLNITGLPPPPGMTESSASEGACGGGEGHDH